MQTCQRVGPFIRFVESLVNKYRVAVVERFQKIKILEGRGFARATLSFISNT